MPLVTLHLLALEPKTSITQYLRHLRSTNIKPLVVSKVIRWIIRPEKMSTHLLNQDWDLVIIVPSTTKIPDPNLGDEHGVYRHWSITAGAPKSRIENFAEKNQRILYPKSGDVPELTGSLKSGNPLMGDSSQHLELDGDILHWSKSFALGQSNAVSMLNLLSMKPTKEAHESYLRYGAEFAKTIGSKRGGNAKIVGKVVPDQGTRDEDKYGWNEIAFVSYPSIRHFTDMLASEDYQKVNQESRVPALRDTFILCTSELAEEVLDGGKVKL